MAHRPVSLPALTLAALLIAAPSARADFNAGLRAYEAGDYARALAAWLPLAEADDMAAMRNVGQMYRLGLGVPADAAKAAEWYQKAAQRGFDRAQANLAALYLTGDGVPQDFLQAARWFDAAARQGHTQSQYNLAVLYERGLGVAKDDARALGWYNLAARAGHKEAMERLSALVQTLPPGLEPTPPPGAQPPPDAARVVVQPVEVRRTVIDPLATAATPTEASPARPADQGPISDRPEDNARRYDVFRPLGRWLFGGGDDQPERQTAPRAASSPTAPPPQTELRGPRSGLEPLNQGLLDYQARDFAAALAAWRPLAEAGDARAQFLVGRLYRMGEGVPYDPVEAYKWFALAARQEHREAVLALRGIEGNLTPDQVATAQQAVKAFRAAP